MGRRHASGQRGSEKPGERERGSGGGGWRVVVTGQARENEQRRDRARRGGGLAERDSERMK